MRKTVVLRPVRDDSNPYITIVRNALESLGYEVIGLRNSIRPSMLRKRIGAVFLNWYENVNSDVLLKRKLIICKKKLCFFYFRYLRKSMIITTVHNKYSHTASNHTEAKKILAWQIAHSDVAIVLNEESYGYVYGLMKDMGYKRVPRVYRSFHPNYLSIIENTDVLDEIKPESTENSMNIIFFGRVVPYKNIELLIKLAEMVSDKGVRISIVGNGPDEYLSIIRELGSNVSGLIMDFRFVEDSELFRLIKESDCVLLPYNKESVLNSGAVMLALSLGKNVICPNVGTVKEFPEGCLYSYDYHDENDHLKKLYEKTSEAANDFFNNQEEYIKRELRISKAIDDYSYEQLKANYGQLLDELGC